MIDLTQFLKNDILYSKLTENIVEIRCKNSQNNNELTTPSFSFVEKLKIIFDFFGNPYFPWNVYIRYKRNYYYNYRIFNDKKLADNFYKFYMDKINPKKNWNILDYGCGEGRVIGLLNQLGFKNIIGQDVYFFKRWEYYNANFVITPIRCNDFYPYKDNVFDAVFSIQVIMYLNDSQLKEHIFNISRILKKGGYFIFEDRNEFMINPKHYLQNKYCPYIHKRDRILELLEQNNFEIIEEKTFGIDTKYFPKFFRWLRNLIVFNDKFDIFDFYEKSWLDKVLKRYLPKGKEPLHLLIGKKK